MNKHGNFNKHFERIMQSAVPVAIPGAGISLTRELEITIGETLESFGGDLLKSLRVPSENIQGNF